MTYTGWYAIKPNQIKPEYWEDSWRRNQTCSQSDSKEILSANADVKKLAKNNLISNSYNCSILSATFSDRRLWSSWFHVVLCW